MRRWAFPLAIGVLALAIVSVAALFTSGALRKPSAPSYGLSLDGSRSVADVELLAAGGQTVRFGDLDSKVTVVYFGYTYCPDVCPTTLASLSRARAELGKRGEDIQVVMVTVDPERDDPEWLEEYVTRFDPSFMGLGGSEEQIRAAAEAFGVYFQKAETDSAAGYLVDHTAAVFVVDENGGIRLMLSHNLTSEEMAKDLDWALKL